MRLALERLSNGTFVYIIVTYCFYRDNDMVRLFVRRAGALPLVPPDLVEDVWFNAIEDRDVIVINTTAFADYVTEYWVEGNNRQQ